MAGPERPPERPHERPAAPGRIPPGEFVSPELQNECARFLEDVKTLVAKRRSSSAFVPVDDAESRP